MTPGCAVVSRNRNGRSLATPAVKWTVRAGVGSRRRQSSRKEPCRSRLRALLLIVLYVDHRRRRLPCGTTQIGGCDLVTARLRKDLSQSLGRTRLNAMGGLLAPTRPTSRRKPGRTRPRCSGSSIKSRAAHTSCRLSAGRRERMRTAPSSERTTQLTHHVSSCGENERYET